MSANGAGAYRVGEIVTLTRAVQIVDGPNAAGWWLVMHDVAAPMWVPPGLLSRCQACTGGPDSGRGHTMRGDCAGAQKPAPDASS
jgi:hypothetical protein